MARTNSLARHPSVVGLSHRLSTLLSWFTPKQKTPIRRGHSAGGRLRLGLEALEERSLLSAAFSEFIDPNPAPGNQFGAYVLPLSTGNVVVTAPYDDAGGADAGAAYLFNGATGALISTLTGSSANDNVGSGGVTPLPNGNYVVKSRNWNNGAALAAGAATFGTGTTGVSGTVSAANSLVGSSAGDWVGNGVMVLSNGNYLVHASVWDNGAATDAGAVTFGSATSGVSGVVSTANSLVGSTANDRVGYFWATTLTNGNYVAASPYWSNGAATAAGAATFGNGTTGISGVVSAANSLVGTHANDGVGYSTALTNGNYVVRSPDWDHGTVVDAGAVTFGNGTTGISGAVSTANSLRGSKAGDQVGEFVYALTTGNYVVSSRFWDNGTKTDVGAATFGSGTTGITGAVSTSNSLYGGTSNDRVSGGFITPLTNGNYVVQSPAWANGSALAAGAVTFGNGTTGVKGKVSSSNSLVGSKANDQVGTGGQLTALTNGNYVVRSFYWDNGSIVDAGAATFGNGTTGVKGVVSASNSLVGTTAGDSVGGGLITALTNGSYVVSSPNWDNGAMVNAGAVTFGNGTTGISGAVSVANSLVGSTASDQVGGYVSGGSGFMAGSGVTALTNGNYVVRSPYWDNGAATDAGAATLGSGTTGTVGTVSAANSLVGSTANDNVGSGLVSALTNGNYVVSSPNWDNGAVTNAGAVTFGNGTSGIIGTVSAANSLVGSTAGDQVGGASPYFSVKALTNGNYVVYSPNWHNGALANAGAVTFGNGSTGVSGVITTANSAIGLTADTGLHIGGLPDDVNGTFFGRFKLEGNGKVRVGSQVDGF